MMSFLGSKISKDQILGTIFAVILLAAGFGIGNFANTVVHEGGHYIVAYFFNSSAIAEFCFQPLTYSCGGETTRSPGAVIYVGYPNAWTPNFGDDPFKVIPVAVAGMLTETVFLVLILLLAARLFLVSRSIWIRLLYLVAIGMVVFSITGWILVIVSILASTPGGASDFCAIGFGLSKLSGNNPAQGTCPVPYSGASLLVLIGLCTAALIYLIKTQVKNVQPVTGNSHSPSEIR